MKKEKLITPLDIAVCVAMILSCIASALSGLNSTCSDIRENVFRLHIIANSDSTEDQALKLKVRDAVLNISEEMLGVAHTSKEAEKITENELNKIIEAAQQVIYDNGFDYEVRGETGEYYFPTREYEASALPAGKYRALRIVLGEGKGHNWWCVMFPPMCLGAACDEKKILGEVLDPASVELISGAKKYEVKFKIVEWYENIKNAIEERNTAHSR